MEPSAGCLWVVRQGYNVDVYSEFEKVQPVPPLRMPIQTGCCDQEECSKKLAALEATIEDLKTVNCTLVESAEELENETYKRVLVMQEVLQKTAHAAKASMVKLSDYEQIVRSALGEKLKLLSEVKKLQNRCLHLDDERLHHQGMANNLMHDVSSLIKLITHARNTGQWNVGNIDFCEVTFEQVFGSVERLSHWSAEDSSGADHSLAESLTEGSMLKRPSSASGVQVFQLQLELRQTQQILGSTQTQLSDRDRMIADLQTQITDLNHELSLKESGCFIHQQMMHKVHENGRCSSIFSEESITPPKAYYQACETNGFAKLECAHDPANGVAPNSCKEDTHALVLELQKDNTSLSKELERQQAKLQSCNEELESVLKSNLKLEQEVALMDNLWQELETYKEDKENLLTKVARKSRRIQELEAQLPRRASTPATSCGTQTDIAEQEVERLKELEQRHQRKAVGLEVVVHQLQVQMSAKDNEANELQAQVQRLHQGCEEREREIRLLQTRLDNSENKLLQNEVATVHDLMVSNLNEQISSLTTELQITLKVLASKDGEIEYQKQTISNLQGALVNLKASPNGSKGAQFANGQVDQQTIYSSTSHLAQRTMSKSREIFDI